MRLNSLYIITKTLSYPFLFFGKSLKSIDISCYSRSGMGNEYNSLGVLSLERLFL